MTGPRLLRVATPAGQKVGVLRVLDSLPFTPARLFWVDAPRGAARGGHAHRTCWQLLVQLHGALVVQGRWYAQRRLRTKSWRLVPGWALAVPPRVWLDLCFSTAGTCAVLASEAYNAAEYITDLADLRR